MRLNKCDTYTAKETLGYKERKAYMVAKGPAKRMETREGQEKKTHKQPKLPNEDERGTYRKAEQSKWIKRHKDPKTRNRSDNRKWESRKIRTQGEIATKLKPIEETDTQKYRDKEND